MGLTRQFLKTLRPRGVIATGRAAGLQFAARGADPQFLLGTYETPIQEAIASSLSEGDVFYDVGANVGFFSLIAARAVGPAGCVYAFEPVPENAATIKRNVELNGLNVVDTLPFAVGAASREATLLLARHIGGAALASAGEPPDMRGAITVTVVGLDDIVAERRLRPPSIVKIDVEGGELDVLRGMPIILRERRPMLIYEIDDATPLGLEQKARDIADYLTSASYTTFPLPASYPDEVWNVRHVLAHPIERQPVA
jgi:FkbM family methyltransferase